ncbi:TetR/AcrR family transcriptional regulator [Dyella sp.]|uniref:TetR/AcrR family transcriptional regulator n=1 Tax=Dyella sp. TaxID=1869338 RepID=UPI002ED4F9B3
MNRSANKRQAVLDAGIDELMAQGLAGASMEAIAQRAAVSKRTLYKYFPSIDAVFAEVVELMISRVEPLGQLRHDANRDFETQLREIAWKEMQLICDEPYTRLSRVIMIEAMRSQAQSKRLLQRFEEKEWGLHRWFADAHAVGKLGQLDPALAVEMFTGILKSCTYWQSVIGWRPAPSPAVQKAVVEEACRMLMARLAHTEA